ncbi:MAG: NADH-quinone oxidoreductase subunit G [Proteobacteria bacterium]|nr:NADH-quinone oxidoreductase subunit G [Pseudomonadota bacterium]
MPKLTIDGQEVTVPEGLTIIQACEMLGVEIPRFCYHEQLAIAGNCRMCLVEVEKSPKPVASCTQPAAEGMVVHTNSINVKKAREGVMEFLLINHPLDCPICDQGGECDLQDQAMAYGRGTSRFSEHKRAVKDKYMGPLIKTHMTRCIHCTRCVRFMEDVAGVPELGAVGRGEDMEITTYIEHGLHSELSGNIIDLCPVGALTSKPYAFKARNWELRNTESIDVLDAICSSIRVDSKGREVMRVLPIRDDRVNEEWISDKARFSYDALARQRIDMPMVRIGGMLQDATYEMAYSSLASKLKRVQGSKIGAIAGNLTDVETMLVMKDFLQAIGSNNYDCRQDGSMLGNAERGLYVFNTTIEGIEKADLCLIIGANPRFEAAVLNARLRKAHLQNNMEVAIIGERCDLSYPHKTLGNNPWIIKQIASGEHPYCSKLKQAKNPMLILGSGVLARSDIEATLHYCKRIAKNYNMVREDWNGFNVLQRAASRVGGMDIGFLPSIGIGVNQMLEQMQVLFLLGADEVDFSRIPDNTFVVYIGHHGDAGAQRADIILPGAAYTEKNGTYVNLEGRVRHARKAVSPPGEAKEDWQQLMDLATQLGFSLGYSDLKSLRKRLAKEFPIFMQKGIQAAHIDFKEGKSKDFSDDPFENPIRNFYMTDVISRNSKTMLQCSQELISYPQAIAG